MSLGNIFGPALAGILFDVHMNLPYSFGAIILVLSLLLSVSWGRRGTGSGKQKLGTANSKG
jgi:DHA1 family multidrug resistance protein-like MFS transporter